MRIFRMSTISSASELKSGTTSTPEREMDNAAPTTTPTTIDRSIHFNMS